MRDLLDRTVGRIAERMSTEEASHHLAEIVLRLDAEEAKKKAQGDDIRAPVISQRSGV